MPVVFNFLRPNSRLHNTQRIAQAHTHTHTVINRIDTRSVFWGLFFIYFPFFFWHLQDKSKQQHPHREKTLCVPKDTATETSPTQLHVANSIKWVRLFTIIFWFFVFFFVFLTWNFVTLRSDHRTHTTARTQFSIFNYIVSPPNHRIVLCRTTSSCRPRP